MAGFHFSNRELCLPSPPKLHFAYCDGQSNHFISSSLCFLKWTKWVNIEHYQHWFLLMSDYFITNTALSFLWLKKWPFHHQYFPLFLGIDKISAHFITNSSFYFMWLMKWLFSRQHSSLCFEMDKMRISHQHCFMLPLMDKVAISSAIFRLIFSDGQT